ncbi:MAG: 6,7-dimethyl-8-ribityllumazine synthase [Candidatus Micrarchaeota archaeon]|nr:6,7-dimethyl-8-ribityllumazine synthase [Candidatus Micrarchaeota archaeon]
MAVKLGIVTSEFNYNITKMMEERAQEHAKFLGAEVTKTVHVPGVFDMPLAVKKLLERKDVDAVVTLGAVLKGETGHDDIVAQHASRKIADLALQYDKPVALGISGPGQTRLQAEARIDEYAKRAVEAAVKLVELLK